jgi:probable addiction module antidote protein
MLQMPTIKKKPKAKPFYAAEYLDNPEMIAAYINEALESEDASAIAVAIGTVARARGMSAVAEKAGLSRENLYRALGGEARPEFGTVIKVLHALGIDLVARPQGSKAA